MKDITIKKVEKIISLSPTENYIYKFIIDDEEIEIEFKRFLSLPDMSQVVDKTVSGCFSDGFAPEYKEVLFFKNFIEVATNLPLPMMNSGRTDEHNKPIKIVDLEKLHEWLVGLNINWIIDGDIQVCELVSKLRKLVDEKLEFQKSIICHPDRDGEVIETVVGFVGKLNDLVSKFSTLEFKQEDIQKALSLIPSIQNISENKFDKETIGNILEFGSVNKVKG